MRFFAIKSTKIVTLGHFSYFRAFFMAEWVEMRVSLVGN